MSSSPLVYCNRTKQQTRLLQRKGRSICKLAASVAVVALISGFPSQAQSASPSTSDRQIRVAAAADLQAALPPIAQRYERKTGVKLVISYGSSGTLATQILNGAPFDLFLGADYVFPEKIVAANLAESKDAIPYAKGTLVLWARKDSPLQPLHLEALSDARVQRIAIADELRAPYGRAAVAALTKLKLYEQLKSKLAVAENVAQAGQFVQSGNAQLGLISLTTAMSPSFREQGSYVLVPDIYPEIRQCAVVMVNSEGRTQAHAFLEWLRSSEVQADLPKLGLEPVR